MPGRHVNRQQAREHERRAWELRQQGWSERRIAAEIGVEAASVHRILARDEKRLVAQLKEEGEKVKVRQTSVLEHITDEALQAWERSKESAKAMTKRTAAKKEGESKGEGKGEGDNAETPSEQVTTHQESRDGNTDYLKEARAALADVRRIWGADAPTKTAQTDPTGTKEAAPAKTPTAADVVIELAPYAAIVREFLAGTGPAGAGEGQASAPGGMDTPGAAPQAGVVSST
jgi:hypothetical protein